MGAQNAKLVWEVARDGRALLQGTSKATLNQLKARRVAMEEELQTVRENKRASRLADLPTCRLCEHRLGG